MYKLQESKQQVIIVVKLNAEERGEKEEKERETIIIYEKPNHINSIELHAADGQVELVHYKLRKC